MTELWAGVLPTHPAEERESRFTTPIAGGKGESTKLTPFQGRDETSHPCPYSTKRSAGEQDRKGVTKRYPHAPAGGNYSFSKSGFFFRGNRVVNPDAIIAAQLCRKRSTPHKNVQALASCPAGPRYSPQNWGQQAAGADNRAQAVPEQAPTVRFLGIARGP